MPERTTLHRLRNVGALRGALSLGALVLPMVMLGCDPGPSTILAPPDSSWLEIGTDAGDTMTTCPSVDAPSDPTIVLTDHGPVRGLENVFGAFSKTYWSFMGIPHSAPPSGPLRFRPPQSAECWADVLDATHFGAKCPQMNQAGTAVGSEDCLTLNVWTKLPRADAMKPVVVWIHGGEFVSGSASDTSSDGKTSLYDGYPLVERDVVVVTIQYRIGALGFLSHRAFDLEDEHHASGNFGLLDQIAALQWVRRNIAAFGGDPARVTIAGQGAGGASVCALVASPLAKGLFSRAIMQSGSCVGHTTKDAQAFGGKVVDGAGCGTAADVAACLRAASVESIVRAVSVAPAIASTNPSPYGPVIDYSFLTGAPLDVISAGGHSQVPILLGDVSDETSRTVSLKPDATDADYRAAVAAAFPSLIKDTVLTHYPSTDYPSPWSAFVALTTDRNFICPARRAARAFLDGQDVPVFRYLLTHAFDDSPALHPYGAFDGADVLYLFGHLTADGYVPSGAESALSDFVQRGWIDFFSAGNPNEPSLPNWPAYGSGDPYLALDSTIASSNGLRTTQCDFWDSMSP